MNVLFVCTGNICRSPTGEAVLRAVALKEGIDLTVASVGTSTWHEGEGADQRSAAAAKARGYDLSRHRSRALKPQDFQDHDLLLAMDTSHQMHLLQMAAGHPERAQKIRLFLPEYAPACGLRDVPDPYYGGPNGFEEVLDLLEAGCRGLLQEVRDRSAAK